MLENKTLINLIKFNIFIYDLKDNNKEKKNVEMFLL